MAHFPSDMQTLHNVKITLCTRAKDDVTKSVHVHIRDADNLLLDLSIYDSTGLCGITGPEFYDSRRYDELVAQAKSKVGQHVDVDIKNFVLVAIREPSTTETSSFAPYHPPPPVNSGTITLSKLHSLRS